MISRSCSVDIPWPCLHEFSFEQLCAMCNTEKKKEKYFKHYTGLKSSQKFLQLLDFLAPNTKEEPNIVYWSIKRWKNSRINTAMLFDSDVGDSNSESDSDSNDQHSAAKKRLLSNEDEFLLVLMKLRLGLKNLDLSMRFFLSEPAASDIIISWINYLYIRLSSLKIWPHRRIIIDKMSKKFKNCYPNTIIIIDTTEIKIKCPSSLALQSQSYSNYKSKNTLKSLIGVDAMGGIMFVSQ